MTSRRLLTPVAKLLLDTADYLEGHGWCQGAAQDSKGRMCVLGAMSSVFVGPAYENYSEGVARVLKQTGAFEIAGWNDAPGRTQDEVVSMLRAAAIAE